MIKSLQRLAGALAVAVVLGGAARAGELVLFQHQNFRGQRLVLHQSVPDLSAVGLADEVSSVVVTSGRWTLCTRTGYRGHCATYGVGQYPAVGPGMNDRIASVRELDADTLPSGPFRGRFGTVAQGEIELYEQTRFRGQALRFDRDESRLERLGFDDRTASIVVHRGTWQLCTDADFRGTCRNYAPGRYADLGSGLTQEYSSLRLLQPQAVVPVPAPAPLPAPVVVLPPRPPLPPGQTGRAILYKDEGLTGQSLVVTAPLPELTSSGFDDLTLSMVVEGGPWEVCTDMQFAGDCRVLAPGVYRSLRDRVIFRSLSSLRPTTAAPSRVP